ncbi:Transposase [Pseudobacteriovorax antillogorgiicola]|uniref:Transposase n=1 Tax=Pseudobacteriovorax antillogorgiicola TaxID=1513793 RepID=A0A1Y6CXD3_9BACT|nr:transposase [Pseudobacteriovorax antillogorgiicola]SMF83892.1 Transposase [Pseudobacteriovorax antillogorgiicola]
MLWATENFIDLKRVQRAYRCSRGLLYKVVYEQLERKRRTRLYDLPSVIGIDEHSLRKRKYQSVDYVTVIVDHKNKRIYEVIDGRNKADLEDAAVAFKRPENVKVVTLDLSNTFKSFAKDTFPNARLVADRFHVQRCFGKLVNRFRKRITGDDRKNPIRRLLLRDGRKLEPYERKVIRLFLKDKEHLREVYSLKERVHRRYRTRGKKRARKALIKILDLMGQSKIPEVVGLRKTILAWRNEIVEYFNGRYSNGRVEGFNRKAKLVQRRAFGFRSFKNYRLQLLNACRGRV